MNAFEDIVLYLEEDGYWVRQRVNLENIPKNDKEALNNPVTRLFFV